MKLKKRKIKAAIIGFGSIGELHLKILKKFKNISEILIITKRNLKNTGKIRFSENINNLINYDPDYIVISSPTSKHYSNFIFIEKKLKKKIVLIEKPLFDKKISYKKNLNNKYLINYNLRELKLIKYLKKFLYNKLFFEVSIICSSYLPYWRKNINYYNSSSGNKKLGGGVLNDLSHEIDYALWIFGDFKIGYSFSKKISNLKINTNDVLHSVSFIKKKVITISLDYFSKIKRREIIINSKNFQLIANLLKNYIRIKYSRKKSKIIVFNDSIKETYKVVHKKILNNDFKNLCSMKEGLKVVKYINKLDKK